MKNLYTLGLSFLLFAVSIYLTAFKPETEPINNPSELITTYYHTGFGQLTQAAQNLKIAADKLNPDAQSLQDLRNTFQTCRTSYKKIEFLIEYLDAEAVKLMLNGAPLPSLAKDTDAIKIKHPEGMQTIEEIVYAENPLEEKEKLQELTQKLAENLRDLSIFHQKSTIRDYQVFPAARLQMIRIISLGLTGFDTPATSNAIPEAEVSLGAVYQSIKNYFPQLATKPGGLDKILDQKFSEALHYLKKNQDFDSFDRLHFLKNYLNPLFKTLEDARKALSIASLEQTQSKGIKRTFNEEAENIFGNDLINPFYYSSLTEADNSKEAIELGKLLFFDPILSKENNRSCASCHDPRKAFTDGQKKSLATGLQGTLDRNAPTLINSIYATRLFYDLRTDNFERQIEHVIYNDQEFNLTVPKILERLNQSEEYKKMFADLYPSVAGRPALNPYSFAAAISAYVTSLRGFDSPFDQYVRGEIKQIDEDVKKGFNLFMGKAGCGTCHFAPVFNGTVPPLFDDSESEVLGVPANKDPKNPIIDPDHGRSKGLLKERLDLYQHAFKTVTVRNSGLTAPYMHNGVYDTLEEVVDFYNRGGGQGLGLFVPNQTLPADPLELTADEQKALVAFMKSLNNAERFISIPEKLPVFPESTGLNKRKIGGEY
ncbi:MAG: cytochrome c peroxidase [Microscillaceae bacterium]|nr:cytochrome c peroxidase [Microscillaceae bacterium]